MNFLESSLVERYVKRSKKLVYGKKIEKKKEKRKKQDEGRRKRDYEGGGGHGTPTSNDSHKIRFDCASCDTANIAATTNIL